MNLLPKIRSSLQTFQAFLRPSSIDNQSTKSVSARGWLAGREDFSPSCTLTSAFQQSTWIYACVTTLAENVSAIPFRLITGPEDNETIVQSSPLLDLFNKPHPQMDRFQFWELLASWLALRGEAFIFPIVKNFGASVPPPPTALLILNPDHLQEIIGANTLMGWRYIAPGLTCPLASRVFLPEELLHIKLPNPFSFWRGMSPPTVAWLAAQTDFAASQFMKGTMVNNADTGLIVTTESQLSPDQREAMASLLRDRKRKAGCPDVPLFLWGGAKVEKPTISAVDLQFLENRKFNRQEICAILKVPQELLGFTEDANRSVSDAARLNFMENRIAPLCKRLEAGIQPIIDQLTNPPAGRDSTRAHIVRGEFHIKGTPIMQAAQRARIDSGVKLFDLGVPLNTVNRVLDLGLPKLPHGHKSFLKSTYKELEEIPREGANSISAHVSEPHQASLENHCIRLLSLLEGGHI